ncbi:ester cyclase [Streptomyces sp. NPDC006638]|uniref:ester cyclase n=1 Tax=Streptomyces sp. NPDC006638 TaxID=3157183 RepID=UPI0033B6D1A3
MEQSTGDFTGSPAPCAAKSLTGLPSTAPAGGLSRRAGDRAVDQRGGQRAAVGEWARVVLAAEWTAEPPLPVGPGPDEWKGTTGYLRSVLADLTFTIEDIVVDGDRVAVRHVTTGKQVAELLGIPSTGRQVAIRASDYHRIEDGRIVRSWHLEDYYGVVQQLGQ